MRADAQRVERLADGRARATALTELCRPAFKASAQAEGGPAAAHAKRDKCKAAKAQGPWDGRWQPGSRPKFTATQGVGGPGGPAQPAPPGCLACAEANAVFESNVTHFFSRMLLLGAGSTLHVRVSDQRLPGVPGAQVDTKLYLLKCGDAACEAGDVVAIDDDGNHDTACDYTTSPILPNDCFDPALEVTVAEAAFYKLVAIGWTGNSGGIADIRATYMPPGVDCGTNCLELFHETDALIGGFSLTQLNLRGGDALMVGARLPFDDNQDNLPDGPAELWEYDDSEALLLTSDVDCDGTVPCGQFRFGDDTAFGDNAIRLSKVEIPLGDLQAWDSRVVVGSRDGWYGQPTDPDPSQPPHDAGHLVSPHFAVMVDRRHVDQGGRWCCDQVFDWDGDGLSWELEQGLGSCDTVRDPGSQFGIVVGFPGSSDPPAPPAQRFSCRDFAELVGKGVAEFDGDRGTFYNGATADLGPCPAVPPALDSGQDLFALGDWPAGDSLGPNEVDRPACWHGRDSDNDGLLDPWEAWGVGFHCSKDPAPPLWDAGSCAAFGLHDDPAATCGSQPAPFCTAEALSARDGVAVDVFDVILDVIYQACTFVPTGSQPDLCGGHATADRDHHLLNRPGEIQRTVLDAIFTEEPQTCWDGSTPPCVEDPARDLPYRAALHSYNVLRIERVDDTTGAELSEWMNQTFNMVRSARRWGHLAHFLHATHSNSCATDPGGRDSGCWNSQNAYHAATFAHELGHGMQLPHNHDTAACSDACQQDQTIATCNPQTADATFGVCDVNASSAAGRYNLPTQSVMGLTYTNFGAVAKTVDVNNPDPAGWACQPENERYSKGLSPCIDESNVSEFMDGSGTCPGGDEAKTGLFRVRRMARDLGCFSTGAECPWKSPFGFAGFQAPLCTDSGCTFDWDRDNVVDIGSARVDVAHGNTFHQPYELASGMCLASTQYPITLAGPGPGGSPAGIPGAPPAPPSGGDPGGVAGAGSPPGAGGAPGTGGPNPSSQDPCKCTDDVLRDVDEWRRIVSVGRAGLGGADVKADVAIYMDAFNGFQAHNEAGWDAALLPVDAVGVFDAVGANYPLNLCEGGEGCVLGCEGGSDCVSGQCDVPAGGGTGECACAVDEDCPGSGCLAGHCPRVLGRVHCDPATPCDPKGLYCPATSGICPPNRSDQPFPTPLEGPPRASMRLRGATFNDRLHLINTGPQSPIALFAHSKSPEVRMDVRFHWHPGDPPRTLWKWANTQISLLSSPVGPFLVAQAGTAAIAYPGGNDKPLSPGRWYRLILWLHEAATMPNVSLSVQEMSVTDGAWGQVFCRTGSGVVTFPPSGDIWIGASQSTSGSDRLDGRVDNISIFDIWHDPRPNDGAANACKQMGVL